MELNRMNKNELMAFAVKESIEVKKYWTKGKMIEVIEETLLSKSKVKFIKTIKAIADAKAKVEKSKVSTKQLTNEERFIKNIKERLNQGKAVYATNKGEHVAVRIVSVSNDSVKAYSSTNPNFTFTIYINSFRNGMYKLITGKAASVIAKKNANKNINRSTNKTRNTNKPKSNINNANKTLWNALCSNPYKAYSRCSRRKDIYINSRVS